MFYKLIFAHLLADFVLQTNWIVKHKRQWHGMTIHISLVLGTMMLIAWDVLSDWWLWILGIAASHALIDWAKLRLDRHNQAPLLSFLADQAIHLTIIAAVVYAGTELADKGLPGLAGLLWTRACFWGIASLYLSCTFAASIALPIGINPASLMQRSYLSRLPIILVATAVLTCTWQGYYLYAPLAVAGFCGLANHIKNQATSTLELEILGASTLAFIAGWVAKIL